MTNIRATAVTAVIVSAFLFGCSSGTEVPSAPGQAKTGTAMASRAMLKKTAPDSRPPKIIGVRKFPYPYQAMLAITSDADHETLRKFNLVHQFLNTFDMTPYGRGVGLDISDSFFMYNGSNLPQPIDWPSVPIRDELTWFRGVTNQLYAATVINYYIQRGWMDSMHTFGDFSQVNQNRTLFTRQIARQAIQALMASGDHVTVWIDHGNKSNTDNFGSNGIAPFFNYQQGANPTSPYYHTDMTIPYGIRFVWTDQIGTHFGYSSMIYPLHLPDGRWVWGFWRYTSRLLGRRYHLDWVWSSNALGEQLSTTNLANLVQHHDYAILAQHLSSNNTQDPLSLLAVAQLRYLAKQYDTGKILVARTSRLLNYNVSQQYVKYYVTKTGDQSVIHITGIADPVFGLQPPSIDTIRGLTFYTSNPANTGIDIWNKPLPTNLIQRNPTDGVHPSIGIPWYPRDTTDYAMTVPGVW